MKVVNQRLIGGIKAGIVLYTFAVAAAGYIFRGHTFGFGVLAGGAVGLLEFWSTSWLVGKILLAPDSKLAAGIGLGMKSVLVLGLVGVLVGFEAVEFIPFLLGLLSLFFGIITGAVIYFFLIPSREGAQG
jgi:hypothetical protein